MSFKHLFSRSLAADTARLHFAAHSHHLWPDASFDGQMEAWSDAARLADRKWDKVMGEIWPEAQAEVAAELGIRQADAIVFAPNTHELLVRLFSALPDTSPIRVLTSDGEFHSARRQLARWEESGRVEVDRVAIDPSSTFSERFIAAARAGSHDVILVSQLMFATGQLFDRIDTLAALGSPEGPWTIVDGYHSFMAVPSPLASASCSGAETDRRAAPQSTTFFLGGGYKYAMSGEGCAFMHAPAAFGRRPANTGWFAQFDDLSLPPGTIGYAPDARRFLGATFDPSALYRFVAVRRMLRNNGLTTLSISRHTEALQRQFVDAITGTPLATAELLNPLDDRPHARFLAFRTPNAESWHGKLLSNNCITDVRGDVLRIGFGLYQDADDVERLARLVGELGDQS